MKSKKSKYNIKMVTRPTVEAEVPAKLAQRVRDFLQELAEYDTPFATDGTRIVVVSDLQDITVDTAAENFFKAITKAAENEVEAVRVVFTNL